MRLPSPEHQYDACTDACLLDKRGRVIFAASIRTCSRWLLHPLALISCRGAETNGFVGYRAGQFSDTQLFLNFMRRHRKDERLLSRMRCHLRRCKRPLSSSLPSSSSSSSFPLLPVLVGLELFKGEPPCSRVQNSTAHPAR